MFDFRRQDIPPLLLILDRRDDPVTPLLNQVWKMWILNIWTTIIKGKQSMFICFCMSFVLCCCRYRVYDNNNG